MVCVYCGRVPHRCDCAKPGSRLQVFLARANVTYKTRLRPTPYKRGVPPQIKRRERATLRYHYREWYSALVEQHGECCQHCGSAENLVLDHIVSIAKGGLSTLDNLQLLCANCNTAKGKLIYHCAAFNAITG
jgi:5-methylcytosine-specific restriction endonuclease McrA